MKKYPLSPNEKNLATFCTCGKIEYAKYEIKIFYSLFLIISLLPVFEQVSLAPFQLMAAEQYFKDIGTH